LKGKDLLSVSDLDYSDVKLLIDDAVGYKNGGLRSRHLERKTLALLFEKPSLRTRVSFETAMRQLGGDCLYLSPDEVGLGKREPVADVARVLSRYVNIIAARTFSHRTLEILASETGIPIINALSDYEHPCQALADLLTIYEKKGRFEGLTLTYIGDGNNVASSLLLACALTGVNFRIACPPDYDIPDDIMSRARQSAAESHATIEVERQPEMAVVGADILYTDVWTSMGQEDQAAKRDRDFNGYQVNNTLLAIAGDDAIVMHPLPAHRGMEITAEVMECPQSVVFDQAENRMHIQRAVLSMLLGGSGISLPRG
jgi:ornithine carbamoyltransferase